ncbi:MAG: hypothetical protein KF784_07425 [Fimbriimonadaceae bacterium]|nr:hypothetical protein [Fimbriimonadaceae bacterium]
MTVARKLSFGLMAGTLVPAAALAQVPDMLNAFDAGGRAMGAGSSMNATGSDTMSILHNPAGLGYIRQPTFGLASRTLPTSKTVVTGSLADKRLDTTADKGDYSLSHLGYATPQGGGAFGISYQLGGWFNDTERGNNLGGGIATYFDFTRVRTSFITLSYGRASADGQTAWGVGVVGASNAIRNHQLITFNDNQIPPQEAESEGTGTGIGAVAGLMFTPSNQSNLTFGISARTPIKLTGGDSNSLYSQIPGLISAGVAIRQDSVGRRSDYMILGAQVDYFFEGKGTDRLMRSDFTAIGAGLEYNYGIGGGTIPIRVGFRGVPAGGNGFDDRNTFTYGFGYRPNNQPWSIELNFAKPTGGGTDTSLYFQYRVGK